MKKFFVSFLGKFFSASQMHTDDLTTLPLVSAEQITAVSYLRCKFCGLAVEQLNVPADLQAKVSLLNQTFQAGVTENDFSYRNYILSFLSDPLCVKIKYAELAANNGCEFLRSAGKWIAEKFARVTDLLADACEGKLYFNCNSLYFGCFSCDSPYPVVHDKRVWKSAEHFHQAQKFSSSNGVKRDPGTYEKIFAAATPAEAREIAEKNLTRDDKKFWSKTSRRFIFKAVILNAKFSPLSDIRKLLYATGSLELINESSTNLFWGASRTAEGSNLLGKSLMQMRSSRNDCSILELLCLAGDSFQFDRYN